MSSTQVIAYTEPRKVPKDIMDTLNRYSQNANVVLPILEKARKSSKLPKPHCWITYKEPGSQDAFDFILSVTEGSMGSYPVFIVTTWKTQRLTTENLIQPIDSLIRTLLNTPGIPLKRVYSIFAHKAISIVFAERWGLHTSIKFLKEPYYAAKLSYCTSATLRINHFQPDPNFTYNLRVAEPRDLKGVADLCLVFAKGSEPFILTPSNAEMEAQHLIENGEVWVCEITNNNTGESAIACIVAYTRNSKKVVTITKVCTSEHWRRRKCAERLVGAVCQRFLSQAESIALYVAHDNEPAKRAYAKVGFVGLEKDCPAAQSVDDWTEIGFDRSQTTLGHW